METKTSAKIEQMLNILSKMSNSVPFQEFNKRVWVVLDKEVIEALIFFNHLKNHPEVKEAKEFSGIPMCKICGKPSTVIALEECLKELSHKQDSTKEGK